MIALAMALLVLAAGFWALGLLAMPVFLLLVYALIGSFFFGRTLAEKRARQASYPWLAALAAGLAWPLVLLAVALYCLGQAWLVRRFERSRRETVAQDSGQEEAPPERRTLLLDDGV